MLSFQPLMACFLTHIYKKGGGTIRVTVFKGKAIRIQLLKITSAQT